MTAIRHLASMIPSNSKIWRIQGLVFIAGSMICLFSADTVRGQKIEEFGEKGSFLLRPRATFQHYCAPCHGETARGDGRYFGFDLRPLPRDLTDAEYMDRKTDEELIASISGGTASIGKSNLCPPWGESLGRKRIEGLVRYLRGLSRTPSVQDTAEATALMTAVVSEERGSPLQLVVLIAVNLVLLGTGWVQWRKLQQRKSSRKLGILGRGETSEIS